MTHLKSLKVYPEDVFREVAYMLDYLLTAEDVNQKEVDGLWVLLINDIREWKSDVQDEDKMLFAGTVFIMVKKILCHHCESRYCDTIYDMLDAAIEEKLSIPDAQEHQQFLDRLLECSDMLSEWVNQYEDCDEWLSEEIEEAASLPMEEELPKMERNARKKGRPKSTLKDKMIDDADGCKLERLRKLMKRKKGKDAALIIFAAVKEGWMPRPSFTQVENEFGDIGSKANFNNYMDAAKYREEEVEGAIKSLRGCD